MNLDYLNYLKEKKEIVSVALLGISAFLAVLMLIKVAGFFAASARAQGVVKKAVAQSNAKDTETFFAESKALADQLKKKNLFAPPPPKQNPVKQVWGILGDEALINGKWYKSGDMVKDAKIVAIEPTQIKVEWEGKQITLAPIDWVSSSPKGKPERAKPGPGAPKPAAAATTGSAEMVVVRPEEGPMPMPGPEGMGGFGRMRGRMADMSEEERERFRAEMRERMERFRNMSPEERQQARESMRERFGGGPGGGPGGGRR